MTKAKASQRAKGNALKKAKKRAARAQQSDPATRTGTGTFDAGNQSIKGPRGAGPGKVFSGAKRGSARSS